ncbi:MAG: pyruvate dehydrogenase complex dihydrolipoyllysine-residue acetyltransferase, partial [Pseudomonadales bacterium]|nr:pyruvate dehydrogenase complex dihydrolipoyllysine-residue acetyltransferase [Pseudomonadales bacterium]
MATEIIQVPDIGSDEAEVIEVCVKAGDVIEAEDSIVVLESDKASMEVPAPKGGKVIAVLVNEEDTIAEGANLIELEIEGDAVPAAAEEAVLETEVLPEPAADVTAAPQPVVAESAVEEIKVPDIGSDEAEVIEVCVSVGDEIAAEDSLVVLESDKASMEVPAPKAGVVESIVIAEGASAKEGDVILTLKLSVDAPAAKTESQAENSEPAMPSPAADAKQARSMPEAVKETLQTV